MTWEFHPEAEQEFIESALRYEAEVPGLGLRFADEVQRVIEFVLGRPETGARVEGEIRRFVLRRFPFSVIYAVRTGTLYVLLCPGGRAREPEARLLAIPVRRMILRTPIEPDGHGPAKAVLA